MKNPKYKCQTKFMMFSEDYPSFVPYCHSIIFKNVGDKSAVINGVWTIDPGEETPAISMMHPEAVDTTEYTINFQGAGVNPLINAVYIILTDKLDSNGNYIKCEKF